MLESHTIMVTEGQISIIPIHLPPSNYSTVVFKCQMEHVNMSGINFERVATFAIF